MVSVYVCFLRIPNVWFPLPLLKLLNTWILPFFHLPLFGLYKMKLKHPTHPKSDKILNADWFLPMHPKSDNVVLHCSTWCDCSAPSFCRVWITYAIFWAAMLCWLHIDSLHWQSGPFWNGRTHIILIWKILTSILQVFIIFLENWDAVRECTE